MNTSARFVRIYGGQAKNSLFWLTPDAPQSRVFQHLGTDQQLICLRAPPVDTSRRPPDLQELAQFYADSIQQAGVQGPVALTGFCIAAVLAREVALELKSRGLDVRALIMIDPPDPAESKAEVQQTPPVHRVLVSASRIVMHLVRMARLGPRGAVAYLQGCVHGVMKRMSYRQSRLAHEQASNAAQPAASTLSSNYLISVAAFMNSSPRIYDGPAWIIRPTDAPRGIFKYPNLRWEQLIKGGVRFIEVPGNSDSMWQEPAVAEMAKAVKAGMGIR